MTQPQIKSRSQERLFFYLKRYRIAYASKGYRNISGDLRVLGPAAPRRSRICGAALLLNLPRIVASLVAHARVTAGISAANVARDDMFYGCRHWVGLAKREINNAAANETSVAELSGMRLASASHPRPTASFSHRFAFPIDGGQPCSVYLLGRFDGIGARTDLQRRQFDSSAFQPGLEGAGAFLERRRICATFVPR